MASTRSTTTRLGRDTSAARFGVEPVSAPFRFNANRYYALSDGKALTALQTEKPMSGRDVDVEMALPYFLDCSPDTTNQNGTERTGSRTSNASPTD